MIGCERYMRHMQGKEQEFDGITAAILAGGASERMGRDKTALTYRGRTFLEIAADAVRDFPERLISAPQILEDALPVGFEAVRDVYPGMGPLGGIHAVLKAATFGHVLVLACDMPMIERDLLRYLCAFVGPEYDAFVPEDRRGWPQSLCAIYAKTALGAIEEQLRLGDGKVRKLFDRLKVKRVPMEFSKFSDSVLMNVNTPEDYRLLKLMEGKNGDSKQVGFML